MPFSIIMHPEGFDLLHGDVSICRTGMTRLRSALVSGRPDLEMVRGNFRIDDVVNTRLPLDCCAQDDGGIRLWNAKQPDVVATLLLEERAPQSILKLRCTIQPSTGFG